MKKRKFLISLLCISALLGVSATALTSCKTENDNPPTPEVEYWTVTIDLNDGSTPTTKDVVKGEKLTGVAEPTREGYEFTGWKVNGAAWTMDTAITANITIVAQWKKEETVTPATETWTVTIDLNDGSTPTTKEVVKGEKLTGVAEPTRVGYVFTGWKVNDTDWTMDTAVTANITIVAQWNEIESISVSGGTSEFIVGDDFSYEGITVTANMSDDTTNVVTGYSVDSSEVDKTKEGTYTITVSYEGKTATYTVTYAYSKVVADGKISMNGTEYTSIANALKAIPATSKEIYTITLGKGTYNENGLVYNGSATIRMVGSTDAKYGADVIIKGHGSVMPGEQGSNSKSRCLISIQGTASIILENLTLESDWYRADHPSDVQAEVLGTDTTGYTAAYNCGFKSHQDTLRTTGKAWFYGCYIEGDVDFIWMEASGKVALYEKCEIVSLYDDAAGTHRTYITAPKMAETVKLGKGLVIFNSTVKESAEAKANGQETYLARTPWSSGCYNQVAYINTICEDIELTDGPWYKSQIATPFEKTTVGWKMDKATADSIGITDQDQKDYILDAETVSVEFNGRNAILNRVFDTGKLRYVTDTASHWEINDLIDAMGWTVTEDTSSDKLEGDTMGEATVYDFTIADGATGAECVGFALEQGKTHYVGKSGSTITIPVNGKCYVEVYGCYAGTVEATADTQEGKQIMFFNNGSTSKIIENDFIVYDENARAFVITAKATTYITKIVVTPDSAIEDKKVESITIKGNSTMHTVGVPLTLEAEIGPKGVINTSVLWTSSDETVAKVDLYTGKVTFIAEGTVTITATACDGSNVTASLECNPVASTWTEIEWYTKDNDLTNNDGNAEGYEVFSPNSSAYKALGKSYTFKNLAGQDISTSNGLKLNSSGKLSFATLKSVEVTIIVAPTKYDLVTPPLLKNANGTTATASTQKVDQGTGLQYFTYSLADTGMWDIQRSDTSQENNPIVYVKVEYKGNVISESTGITFKGTQYNTTNTGIATIFTPGSLIEATDSPVEVNKMNFTNCASNGSASNWLVFNTGAKIELKVDKATTLLVGYYSKLQTVKLDGVVVEGDKTTVTNGAGDIVKYQIAAGGTITIEATSNDYLGFVGVLF